MVPTTRLVAVLITDTEPAKLLVTNAREPVAFTATSDAPEPTGIVPITLLDAGLTTVTLPEPWATYARRLLPLTRVTARHSENSDVLPAESVAVAVTNPVKKNGREALMLRCPRSSSPGRTHERLALAVARRIAGRVAVEVDAVVAGSARE